MSELKKELQKVEEMYASGAIPDQEMYEHMKSELLKSIELEEQAEAARTAAAPPPVHTPPPPVQAAPQPPAPKPPAPKQPVQAAPPALKPQVQVSPPPPRTEQISIKTKAIIQRLPAPSHKIVELKNVSKVYDGGVRSNDNNSFIVGEKEFAVLLGPLGCGKSTLLSMIAGFEAITEGEIFIDGEQMNRVPPKDRNISFTSQNYKDSEDKTNQKKRLEQGAMSFDIPVSEILAYDLQIRKVPKPEIDKRMNEAAKMLDIDRFLDRKLKALSGGQRTRVAIVRAIMRNPKVFIFDDILSGLDSRLRVQMRAELADLHQRLNATIIYATSDQAEAMNMATKIVVMKDGRVQQVESPMYLYNYPANKFVAGFLGSPSMNFLNIKVREENGYIVLDEGSFKVEADRSHHDYLRKYIGKEIYWGIRPEDLTFCDYNASDSIALKITVIQPLGHETHLWLTTKNQPMVARVPPDYSFKVGDTANFIPKMEKAHYFDKDSENAILPLL